MEQYKCYKGHSDGRECNTYMYENPAKQSRSFTSEMVNSEGAHMVGGFPGRRNRGRSADETFPVDGKVQMKFGDR